MREVLYRHPHETNQAKASAWGSENVSALVEILDDDIACRETT